MARLGLAVGSVRRGNPLVTLAIVGRRPWCIPRWASSSVCCWQATGSSGSLVGWSGLLRHADRLDGRSAASWRLAASGLAWIPGIWLNLAESGQVLEGLPADDLPAPERRASRAAAHAAAPLAASPMAGVGMLSRAGGRGSVATVPRPHAPRLGAGWWSCSASTSRAWRWRGTAVERLHHLRLTLFQPFRMATIARGLCLVLVSGHWSAPLAQGIGQRVARAVLLAVGLAGDWTLVVVTAFELVCGADGMANSASEPDSSRPGRRGFPCWAMACYFLSRHDTESGHLPLLVALIVTPILCRSDASGRSPTGLPPARAADRVCVGRAHAGVAGERRSGDSGLARFLVARASSERCRFAEVPPDDVERLAVWCRTHPPARCPVHRAARSEDVPALVAPEPGVQPGGEPLPRRGLADWSRGSATTSGFEGSPRSSSGPTSQTATASRGAMTHSIPDARAALAVRQGAQYVIGPASRRGRA